MKIIADTSGQTLIELSLVLAVLCVLVFGIIDFGRAIYDVEVMRNLAAEGSSMASRGASPSATATAVVTYGGADIGLSTNGCVIVTDVTENSAGTAQVVTAQSWAGDADRQRPVRSDACLDKVHAGTRLPLSPLPLPRYCNRELRA